jgi:hypothetical protein
MAGGKLSVLRRAVRARLYYRRQLGAHREPVVNLFLALQHNLWLDALHDAFIVHANIKAHRTDSLPSTHLHDLIDQRLYFAR